MKKFREIQNDLESFYSDEPAPDHFERFEVKLNRHHSEWKRKYYFKLQAAIASAVAIFIIVFLALKNMPVYESPLAGTLPDEVKEISLFYENRIEANYQTLNSVANCPKQRKEIQICMQDFEESMKEIKKDLQENPEDEHLINAFVNQYRIKLEITDLLIKRTKEYCF